MYLGTSIVCKSEGKPPFSKAPDAAFRLGAEPNLWCKEGSCLLANRDGGMA